MITRLLGSGITSTVGGVNPCLADLKGDMYLIAGARQCTSVKPTGTRAIPDAPLVSIPAPRNVTVGRHVKQGLSNRVRAHRALTNSAGSCLAGAGLRAGLLRLNVCITFRTSKVI